jgi:sulfate adenylyltransferase subunit 2
MLIDLNDERLKLKDNEESIEKEVRFRTLGCYPLTGAVESNARTLEEIVLELIKSNSSERQGRVIDKDENASMEQKKKDGYF